MINSFNSKSLFCLFIEFKYTKTTDFCHPTFPAEVPAIIYPWTDWTWLPSSFPPQACTSVSGLCGHDMAFRTSGRPIQIVDRIYGHGWGVPRSGQVLLRVNERCGNLEFTTGLDYSSGAFAGAVFEVWTDGIQISRSPYTMRDSPGRKHRIDLLGVRNVTLVVKGSGKANAVFADPILSCGPMSPFLPSVVIEPIGFDGNWGTPGQKVQFRATALDRLGRNLGPGSMKWALRVGYCTATQCEILPTIRGPISRGVDAAFSLPLVAAGCRFYFVRAEVVDSCGAKNFASWSIKIPGRCGFAQARFPDQKPDRVKKTMRPVQTDQTVAW